MHRFYFFLFFAASIISLPAIAQDGPEITFLEGDAARAAIVDESVEPYFSRLCLHEMQVKSGMAIEGETLDAQREAFKTIYADAVVDFTDDEQGVLTEIIDELHAILAEHYPRLAAYPWSFIKSERAIEQGLPHTRGRSIVLPDGFLNQIIPVYQRSPERMMPMLMNLLIHEQMHVVQRLEPETFEPFYTEQWGLMHVEKIEYDNMWLMDRQLINPDGVDVRWVQNVGTEDGPCYIQPNIIISLHEDRPSRMPHDFQMVAIELTQGDDEVWRPVMGEDDKPIVTPLMREPGYMAHYGNSSNVYHPNESLADLFATLVLLDCFDPPGSTQEQIDAREVVMSPIRDFMREAFGGAE